MQAADGYCNFKDSACLGIGCYQGSRKLKGREAMAGKRQHLPRQIIVIIVLAILLHQVLHGTHANWSISGTRIRLDLGGWPQHWTVYIM